MPSQRSSDGALLRSAVSTLNHRLRRQDGPASVGPTAIGLLGLLLKHGPATAGELAELAYAQPQSLTRALHALEEEGFIGRRPDEDDRRRAILWITPKGELEVLTIMRRRVSWLNGAMD